MISRSRLQYVTVVPDSTSCEHNDFNLAANTFVVDRDTPVDIAVVFVMVVAAVVVVELVTVVG